MSKSIMMGALAALGAALVVVHPAAGATSAELLKCQKSLESGIRSFTGYEATKVLGCTEKIVNCKLANEIDAVDPTACLAAASTACSGAPTQVSDAQTTRRDKVVLKCGLIPFMELEQFVAGLGFFNVASACGAGDATALVTCIFADSRCSTEHQVFIIDPRAQDSLTTAGVAGSFPCVGP